MIVGNLVIEMAMNVARLQTDVEKANTLIGNHVRNVEKSMRQVQSLLGSLGIGLSIAGLTSAIKSSIDFADRLNDLSETTNLTVTQLAGLDLASRQTGTDLEGAARAIDKLSVNMGKNAKEFDALGINSTDKLAAFKQFADVFNSISDVHQRDAFAAAALGKEWQTLVPLLSEGGAKIAEMVEKGERLSGVTEENVKRADEFNDKLDELTVTFRGLGLTLGNEMFPKLISLNEWFTELGISAIEFSEKTTLAFKVLTTPSAWFNDKEMADLEARFQSIGKMADEARAAAKAEIQPGTGPAGAGRKTGSSPDVSAFTNPDDLKAREKQEKITQDALTQIKVDAFNQQIADRDAYDNAMTELYVADFDNKIQQEQALEDALTQIKVDAFNQRMALQNAGNANAMQQLAVAGTQFRAFFELNKIARTADAVIEGYAAVQKAYAWGTTWGGPVGGAAMAAIAAAATAANVMAIQSAHFGGGTGAAGAGGGGGGAPITTPSPLAPQPNTAASTTNVTINLGEGLYSAGAVRELIDKINEQVRDGAVIGNIMVSS